MSYSSKTQEWDKILRPWFEYEMTYSNMSNDKALEIIDRIVSNVLADIRDEEYSSVQSMIERAYDRFQVIKESRK